MLDYQYQVWSPQLTDCLPAPEIPAAEYRHEGCAFQPTGPIRTDYVIHPDWVSERLEKEEFYTRKYRPWNYEFKGARHWGIPEEAVSKSIPAGFKPAERPASGGPTYSTSAETGVHTGVTVEFPVPSQSMVAQKGSTFIADSAVTTQTTEKLHKVNFIEDRSDTKKDTLTAFLRNKQKYQPIQSRDGPNVSKYYQNYLAELNTRESARSTTTETTTTDTYKLPQNGPVQLQNARPRKELIEGRGWTEANPANLTDLTPPISDQEKWEDLNRGYPSWDSYDQNPYAEYKDHHLYPRTYPRPQVNASLSAEPLQPQPPKEKRLHQSQTREPLWKRNTSPIVYTGKPPSNVARALWRGTKENPWNKSRKDFRNKYMNFANVNWIR